MAKLPRRPRPLEDVAADVRVVPAGTVLWRCCLRGGPHPCTWDEFRFFGPLASARFDHHLPPPGHLPPPRGQERGILYAAALGPTCLAEAFQRTRTINRRRNAPSLASFALRDDLRLLDLTGGWPTAAGGSQALSSGPRRSARCWSQEIYLAYPEMGGLWYPSSMDGGRPALALYERARPALPHHAITDEPLAHRKLDVVLEQAAARIGCRLL